MLIDSGFSLHISHKFLDISVTDTVAPWTHWKGESKSLLGISPLRIITPLFSDIFTSYPSCGILYFSR